MMMMMMMMATMIACDDMTVVTLGIPKAVGIKMMVFGDVTPCSSVDGRTFRMDLLPPLYIVK